MQQRAKKSKSPDNRPARKRYWLYRRLEKNKVKRLVKCSGMTPEQALKVWRGVRKTRVPNGFIYVG